MSTDELLAILKDRGLTVVLGADGQPRLRGDSAAKSEKLLKVLKLEVHRNAIIERFKPQPRREFLYPLGQVLVSCNHLPLNEYPEGSWYWRWEGEEEWWPVPGKSWPADQMTEEHKRHAAKGQQTDAHA